MEKRKIIFVVDDNTAILDSLSMLLVDEGYEVQPIGNYEELIRLIHSYPTPPNLIILDVLLGGMDGRIIARQLRTDEDTQDIPIIAISADKHILRTIDKHDVNTTIQKPFEMDHLISTIKQYIS